MASISKKWSCCRSKKNRDGWAYLWNKQMNAPLVPTPNLSKFEKLELSQGIKKNKDLKITQLSYDKKFKGGEKRKIAT